MITDLEEMSAPFAFDFVNAEYLFSSQNLDISGPRLKAAFKKSTKSEVVTMHLLREKIAIQGQLNAITVH